MFSRTAMFTATVSLFASCWPVLAAAQGDPMQEMLANDGTSVAALSVAREVEPSSDGTGVPAPAANRFLESKADDVWKLLRLPTLSAFEANIETILYPDDRTQVTDTTKFPQRAIVLLTNSAGRCTGWLIGADTVVTAGHCVHSGGAGGSWYKDFRVYPGRNGPASPFGSCGWKRAYSVRGWVENRAEAYDYGAIKLDCSVGNQTGWLGFFSQAAPLDGTAATISGYPGDKPLEQWASVDRVRASDATQAYYQNDTIGGNSGGSVALDKPGCGVCAHTIHAYGIHGSGVHVQNNHGTRINRDVFNNLLSWKQAN